MCPWGCRLVTETYPLRLTPFDLEVSRNKKWKYFKHYCKYCFSVGRKFTYRGNIWWKSPAAPDSSKLAIFPPLGWSCLKSAEGCRPLTCACVPNLFPIGFGSQELFPKGLFFVPINSWLLSLYACFWPEPPKTKFLLFIHYVTCLCSGSSHWQWCARDYSGFWQQLVRQLHLTWRLVPSCAVALMCHSQMFSFTFCHPSSSTMDRRWATFMHSRQVSVFLCSPPLGGCIVHYIQPSACLSICPVTTINSKNEHPSMFKLSGEVTNMKNNWQSSQKVTDQSQWGQKCKNHFWHISLRKIHRFMWNQNHDDLQTPRFVSIWKYEFESKITFGWANQRPSGQVHLALAKMCFLSASLYFSKRVAYWDRLCRDVVGCHARALWPNGAS